MFNGILKSFEEFCEEAAAVGSEMIDVMREHNPVSEAGRRIRNVAADILPEVFYDSEDEGLYNVPMFDSSGRDYRRMSVCSPGNPECHFFVTALSIVDDSGINGSRLLLPAFHRLTRTSNRGFIKRWDEIPFAGGRAPRKPRSGYIFVVEKVFELLGQVYESRRSDFRLRLRVREVPGIARRIAEGRQEALDRNRSRQDHERQRRNHQRILNVWSYAIASLERTISWD